MVSTVTDLAVSNGVLQPLVPRLRTLVDLAHFALVCSTWCQCSREELAAICRRIGKQFCTNRSECVPHQVAALSFIDKALLVADKIGLDVVRTGGITSCVRRGLIALRLCASASVLFTDHEITFVGVPEDGVKEAANARLDVNRQGNNDSELVFIANVERVPAFAVGLVEDLFVAFGLLAEPLCSGASSSDLSLFY